MKYKNIFSALIIVGVLSITGCSTNSNVVNMAQISDASMPAPFEHNGGDENNDFFHPCIAKFDNVVDLVCELAHDDNAVQEWVEEMNNNETPCQIDEYINLYSFMVHFNIPAEDVCAALQDFNKMQEQWRDERGIPINSSTYYTEDDLEALKSENMETITNYFASTYSIVVDDNIYSPNWIYYHTVDDYAVCGITADDIKDHISQYSNINFESNALSAFESKISNYIGESISFDGIGSDFIAEDTSNTTDIIG